MKKVILGWVGPLLLVAALAVLTVAGRAAAEPKKGTGTTFTMTGAQVVPGPGDPDALGDGGVRDLDSKTGQLCFFADISGASEPFTAGHIHQAPGGEAGPVVVVLFDQPISNFDLENGACVSADPKIVKQIDFHPEDFYMDLHNDEFPDGAVRGQLAGCARVC